MAFRIVAAVARKVHLFDTPTGHSEVACMTIDHRAQVLPLLDNGLVHTPAQFLFDCAQFGLPSLCTGQPQYHESALAGLRAAMCEAQKVKRLRFAHATAVAVLARKAPELDQPCLALVQLQAKAFQPSGHLALKSLGIPDVLEPLDPIVGVTHDDHLAFGVSLTPLPHPQVQRIVKVDVGQQRADTAALHCSYLALRQPAICQHSCVQPFLDQPHEPCVGHPVLDELDQPVVFDRVVELADVRIEYPVHLPALYPHARGIKRVVRAFARTKAVAEPDEVLFVDRIEYFDCGKLHELVLQRGHAQRALAAVGFVDVHAPDRLGPVRPSGQPCGQFLEFVLQVLSIRLPCLFPRVYGVFDRAGFFITSPTRQ